MAALLAASLPTLEATDLFQDREAADRFLAAVAVGAGDLQTGQWRLPVVPVLQSRRVTEVTGMRLSGSLGGRSLSLGQPGGRHRLCMNAGLVR